VGRNIYFCFNIFRNNILFVDWSLLNAILQKKIFFWSLELRQPYLPVCKCLNCNLSLITQFAQYFTYPVCIILQRFPLVYDFLLVATVFLNCILRLVSDWNILRYSKFFDFLYYGYFNVWVGNISSSKIKLSLGWITRSWSSSSSLSTYR